MSIDSLPQEVRQAEAEEPVSAADAALRKINDTVQRVGKENVRSIRFNSERGMHELLCKGGVICDVDDQS